MPHRRVRIFAALAALSVAALAGAAHAQAAARPFHVVVKFTATPAGVSNVAMPTFTLARNVHYKVRSQHCRVDTNAWHSCRNAWKPGHLADGTHTAYVLLLMKDGKRASDSYTWRIDTAPPAVPVVTGQMTTFTNDPSHTLHVTDSAADVARFEYRVSADGVSYDAARVGANPAISTEGVTSVEFRAVDHAGNQSPWSTANAIMLDRTGPGAPAATAAGLNDSGWTNQPPVAVQHDNSADDGAGSGVASYQYRTTADGGSTWTAAQDGSSFNLTADGSYQVEFRAVDMLGNVGDWGSPSTVGIDTAAPAAPNGSFSVQIGPNSPNPQTVGDGDYPGLIWYSPVSSVGFSGNYDLSGSSIASVQTRYQVNGGSWVIVDGVSFTPADNGRYLVETRSVDNAGNVGAWSDSSVQGSQVGILQTLPPAPSGLTTTPNGDGTLTISWDAVDNGDIIFGYQIQSSFDGQTWMTFAGSATNSTGYVHWLCEDSGPVWFRVSAWDIMTNGEGNGARTDPVWSTPYEDDTYCAS